MFAYRAMVTSCGVLAVFLGLGCGHKYAYTSRHVDSLAGYRSVAVMPLENLSELKGAEQALGAMVATELERVKGLTVIEPQARMFAEDGRRRRLQEIASELKEKQGVELILFGSVTEYSYRKNARLGEFKEPVVGLNLRLMDTWSGKVIWSGAVARSSSTSFTPHRDPLARVARLVVMDVVGSIREGRL